MESLGKDRHEDETNEEGQKDNYPVSEDMVAWMTEPTPSCLAPRSDCG